MKKYKNLLWILLVVFISITAVIYSYNLNRNKIDVSVIVPIYNVEKYLDECLNSIENQTKTDGVEIICINDGSKDNSFEILKQHASKNNNIKIINQENRGLSAARNEGMKIAKGKYIMFVDSDDVIVPYAIEKSYQTAEKYDVDIVKYNKESFNDGDSFDVNQFVYDDTKVWESTRKNNENPFEVWENAETNGPVWNKLFKREFIEKNELRFKENVIFEDCLFLRTAFPQTTRIAYNDNTLYGYRANRNGSIMNEAHKDICKYFENNLIISRELMNQRYRIKFDDSDNWIIAKLFENYDYVNNPTGSEYDSDIRSYSRRYLTLVENFIKKYDVKLSEKNRNKIDNLRKLSENI